MILSSQRVRARVSFFVEAHVRVVDQLMGPCTSRVATRQDPSSDYAGYRLEHLVVTTVALSSSKFIGRGSLLIIFGS